MIIMMMVVSCRFVGLGAGVQGVLRAAGGLAVLDDARSTQDVGGLVAVLYLRADVCTQCGLRQRRRQPWNDHRRIRCTERPRLYTGHRCRQLGSTASCHVRALIGRCRKFSKFLLCAPHGHSLWLSLRKRKKVLSPYPIVIPHCGP